MFLLLLADNSNNSTIIIIAVIAIALHLTYKGEHTALCRMNNNEYIKISKVINYIVIVLYSSHTTPLRTHPSTHTHTHTGAQKEWNEE